MSICNFCFMYFVFPLILVFFVFIHFLFRFVFVSRTMDWFRPRLNNSIPPPWERELQTGIQVSAETVVLVDREERSNGWLYVSVVAFVGTTVLILIIFWLLRR